MQSTHDASLRAELRKLLELSVQPLALYTTLLEQFEKLDEEDVWEQLTSLEVDQLRDSFRALLPDVPGPYLDLAARAKLCSVVAQTTPAADSALAWVLLEHFAFQLEPYLRAADLDPDQARYIGPSFERLMKKARPLEVFVEARRTVAEIARAAQVSPTARRARK